MSKQKELDNFSNKLIKYTKDTDSLIKEIHEKLDEKDANLYFMLPRIEYLIQGLRTLCNDMKDYTQKIDDTDKDGMAALLTMANHAESAAHEIQILQSLMTTIKTSVKELNASEELQKAAKFEKYSKKIK